MASWYGLLSFEEGAYCTVDDPIGLISSPLPWYVSSFFLWTGWHDVHTPLRLYLSSVASYMPF